ncbi:hypothetical protein AB6A40_008266 [Gnathostoma spinigerum]|uniref:Uncharacterized protein n=1 Tax=Gnathostoma spinigerum TaxID=75299 RepID=A0ABD6EXY5_9BILA
MEAERRRNVENDSDGNMDDTSNSFFSAEDQSDVEQLKYDCASLPDSMDENMEGINVSHVEISSDADDVDDDDVSISSELMEVIGAINKLQIKPAVEIIHRLYATIASNNEPCGISRIEAHYALDWKENLSEEAKKMNCSTVSELLESEIMHDFIEFAAFDEKTHETLYRAKALPQTEHILQYLCESKLDEEQKKMKKIAERNIALRKPENQSNFIEGKRRILSLLLEMKAYENPVFYSDLQKIYLERFQKTLNEAELKRMFMRKKALKNFRLVFAKEVRIVCECPIQIMLVSADIELPTLMQEEDLDIVSGLTEVPVFPVSPFIAHCQTEISGYQKASLKKRTEPENRQKHLKFQETLMGKPATVNWNVTIEKCPEVNKRDQTCWRSDSSSENEQPVRFNETNGNQNHFTTRDSDGVYTDDEDDSGNAKNNVTMLKESDEKQSSKMVNKPATLARRSLINSTVSPSKGAEEESVNDGKIRQRVKPICMSVSYDVTNKDSKEYSVQPNETRPPPTLAVLGRRTGKFCSNESSYTCFYNRNYQAIFDLIFMEISRKLPKVFTEFRLSLTRPERSLIV